MSKALITVLATGVLAAAAVPALAQAYDTTQREATLRDRIADGLDRGDLSIDQAQRLRIELRQIVNLDDRYQDEGMADWQARDINSRLSLLDSRLNYDLGMNRDAGY
ncbi:MAG TPA: hypothetical protein VMU37_03325 [Caulobacteraceae bacterium]|nr:hypothetical protein [Caulobacteraceae bacterium]